MTQKQQNKTGLDQIWTIELTGVDISMPLHELALGLSSYVRSIVAIFRKADYERFLLKDTVYVQLVDEQEFIRLTRNVMIVISDKTVRIESAHQLVHTSIPFGASTNGLSASSRSGAPMSLHVYGLDKNNLKPTYIFLLRELLMIFEKSATITGIKMTYDVKSKRTLSYFFINFLFRKQLEDFDQVKIPFNDKLLQCELCHQVQLLMVASDLHFLQKGTWNEPIRRSNLLCDAPLDETTALSRPSIVISVPDSMPTSEKQKRKPMKRRQPVEVEERPLPAYPKPGKAKILSVEILPRFDFEAETPADCEDDNVVQINLGEADLLSLVLSICIIILLTRLSEAKPTHHHHHNHHHHHHHHHNHHKQRLSDTMSDVFDFKCRFEMPEDPKMDNQKPENVLSDRLRAILLGCQDTLAQTKDLIDEYIKTMWTQNVEELHKTWKHEDLLWLHPNNTPLQKEFNKSINAEHLAELKKVNWKDQNKVFEYLGRIYQRLERVYVGIQIVNKWIELAQMDQNKNIMNNTELDKSKALFTQVTKDIRRILCQIRELFIEVARDPSKQQDLSDISPIREQVNMDATVKLNHWLIYREYHNLMDYSQELLDLIIKKYQN